MNEEKLLKRIVTNPKIMLGKPVIKGTRLTVELIVEKVAYGETIENLKKDYPFITEDDIRELLILIEEKAEHVILSNDVVICRDKDDNLIIETAVKNGYGLGNPNKKYVDF